MKAVSDGILGNVSCLWGTQCLGFARCFLILSLLVISTLYVSNSGVSAKAMTVSLPMYRQSTLLRLKMVNGIYLGLYLLLGLFTKLGGKYTLGFLWWNPMSILISILSVMGLVHSCLLDVSSLNNLVPREHLMLSLEAL